MGVDLRETRTMVEKKSADSGKSSCSVYILLGEDVGFLIFVFCFLVHLSLFGCWENGRIEMNVQLHQYIYTEITPHLGCSGFEKDENHGKEEIYKLS